MLEISCIILFEYISSLYSCSSLDAVVEIGDEERPVPDHMEMLLCVCSNSAVDLLLRGDILLQEHRLLGPRAS